MTSSRTRRLSAVMLADMVGDVVDDADGVYGDGVNVASRVESLATPGGVLVSDKVHDEIRNHADLGGTSLGTVSLKNVARPVEIFALTGPGLPIPGPFRQGGVYGFFSELKRRGSARGLWSFQASI